MSFLWASLVGAITLLCLAPLARANTIVTTPAGTGGWTTAKETTRSGESAATSTSATDAATRPLKFGQGKAAPRHARESSDARLKWRPAYAPQLSSEPAVATDVRRVDFSDEADEPALPTGKPQGQWAPKGQLPLIGPVLTVQIPNSRPAPDRRPAPRRSDDFFNELARAPELREVDCAAEQGKLKPIGALTNNIAPEPGKFPPECTLGGEYVPRCWEGTIYTWKASNLCHKPLYFEQPAVERYGHSLPPLVQPAVSAAHFFVSVPLLPYKMGLELPNECMYSLGYYRPGSCAPYHVPGIPLSVRGAVFETGLVGLLFLCH